MSQGPERDEPELDPATIAEVNAAEQPIRDLHNRGLRAALDILDTYTMNPGEPVQDILNRMPEPIRTATENVLARSADYFHLGREPLEGGSTG